MLGQAGCTIYEHRPRTCRTYDCRVFTATGITPDEPLVADRAAGWVFELSGIEDEATHEAVRDAARFLQIHPEIAGSTDPTIVSVLADELSELFVGTDQPRPGAVREAIRRRTDEGLSRPGEAGPAGTRSEAERP